MRILYIIGGGKKAYGSERVAMDIMKGVLRSEYNDIDFVVITANDGPINDFCKENEIENHVIHFDYYVYKKHDNCLVDFLKRKIKLLIAVIRDYIAIQKIKNVINIDSIDIVHSNLSRTMLGARLTEKYNIHHIWYLQELLKGHYGLDLLMDNQIEYMNTHCNQFIAISDAVKNTWINGGLDASKITRVYNGIDINDDCLALEDLMRNKKIEIVMVGELCEAKGQYILLEALHILQDNAKQFRVHFIGDGKTKYIDLLKSIVKKYELDVVFHGFIKHESLNLKHYDIGVACSKGEGFGLSTLEYMRAGICVLAADTGANCELIADETVGIIFKRENRKDLADKLYLLSKNNRRMMEYGANAKQYAKKNFDINNQLLNIIEIYNQQKVQK